MNEAALYNLAVSGLQQAIGAFIGLAGGIAVGGSFVAVFVVLDVLPRLAQLTGSYRLVQWFEYAMVLGTLTFTTLDFWYVQFKLGQWLPPIIGLLDGIFIGLVAAALTEVLNVLPILAKRLGMSTVLTYLLIAMVLGKICGSLFDWFVYRG
ncbi:stage V sporulation protein AB [Paenibacillus sp. 481]|uniref:stage V sporulation protein AB n=1 Tax=Paenibacillus sp. 481 TaxID=2835869 RepID=UPI001E5299A0|nr:stage V sporulation protein AB [Paenibacillus sp. 481]UHA76214.1 stage V sporulation protein AB [Paenibacillus sp. 481]